MYWSARGDGRYKKGVKLNPIEQGNLCLHALFSHNPEYCVDIVHAHKPAFTPRVAFILGSGLGALADQIEDAVAISYEKLPGFPVSTVHGHAGELVLGHLAGVPVACMKGRGHFYEGRGMAVMTDAIRTLKITGL
ncbi:purine nucleoside phosphorylase [Salmonella enterica subsp. enterica]|uniref:Purine nucleoside phosphorylase n=1 Tax=Salmonella enterica I TaxID=59201 RepID=A0A447TYM8_SALET|nr:purine nucleoside phosphorylase [Salmonella enterica subsp. enterica]